MAVTTFKDTSIISSQINLSTATPLNTTNKTVGTGASGSKQFVYNCDMAGWRPIGVVGYNTGNPDLIPMIFRLVEKQYSDYNVNSVYLKLRNVGTSSVNLTNGYIDVLYIRE